jgi:hypothetical protein
VELDDVFSGESEVQRHLQPLLQSSSHYASGAGLRLRGGAAGGDESQPQEEQGDSLQQQLCQTVIPGHPVGSAAPQVPGSKEVGTEPSSPALRDQAWAAGGLLSEGATDSAGGVVSSSYCRWVAGTGELAPHRLYASASLAAGGLCTGCGCLGVCLGMDGCMGGRVGGAYPDVKPRPWLVPVNSLS